MVSDEWTGCSTTSNLLQDRRLHLRKTCLIKDLAHRAENGGTLQERVLHTIVDNQIDITLTVSQFWVFKCIKHLTILLLHHRQRLQALGQHGERLGMHTDLACLSTEDKTLHANEVTQIQQLLEHHIVQVLVLLWADVITGDIHLNPALRVLQLHKACLTHHTTAHHATSNADLPQWLCRIALSIHRWIFEVSYNFC